jgi:drug/metabolite transporter (DMT)-like permease
VTKPSLTPEATGRGDVGARLMLVALCIVWGTTWPVLKIGLNEMPSLSMRSVSAALGALTLYLICRVKQRSFRIPSVKAAVHVAVAAMLNIVAFTVLSALAQTTAATGRVAVLAYTMPIWAVLFAWIFLRDRPNRMQIIALGLCIAGLAVLIYPLMAAGVPIGIALALSTGVSWGAGTVYLKWAQIDADPMGVASWQMTIAAIVITVLMFVFDGGLNLSRVHADGFLAIAWIGMLGNGVAYGLWFTIVRRLPAAVSSLGVLGSPVIGVAASVPMLGERPTTADLIGFALIFCASACVLLSRRQSPVLISPGIAEEKERGLRP